MTSMLLLASLTALPHTFRFVATEPVDTVAVAGEFNQWAQIPMQSADKKTWTVQLQLEPGRYQYKFVLNGRNWIVDPANPRSEGDGNGNTNSVLVLFPKDFGGPAVPTDGKLTRSVLTHAPRVPDLNYDGGKLNFRLTIRPNDAQRIEILTGDGKRTPLTRFGGNEVVETYKVTLPWDGKKNVRYAFRIVDGGKVFQFGPNGLTPANSSNFFNLTPQTYQPFRVPGWVQGTVFYQIFPDRFANGDKRNDPGELMPWTAEPTWWNRFGGDAAGMRAGIPYLRALGVNGVYINPVMMAPSNHRYDPVDFYRVDPEIGTNQEFADMTRAMHGQGIRVVLDQIFDHVGTTFSPFADLLRWQEKSRYRDWFFVKSYPVEVRQNPPYEAWYGFESMPKLNMENPEVISYLLDSVDYWMRYAKLSGWRLDVANEVPPSFWRKFRPFVKERDPNAWIVGEVWTDARQWLQGDQWDASMNYPFRNAAISFVAKGNSSPTQLVNQLMDVYGWYAPQVSRSQLNLLSSHDTARFITEAGDDVRLAAMGAVLQFTWVGAPSVYYGEELGMLGGADPQNRRPMAWSRATGSNSLFRLYQQLTRLRTGAPVFSAGDPVRLNQHDAAKVAAFGRQTANDFAFTVMNRGNAPFTGLIRLPAGQAGREFIDGLTGRRLRADAQGQVRVSLGPLTSLVALNATPTHVSLVRSAQAAAKQAIPKVPQ